MLSMPSPARRMAVLFLLPLAASCGGSAPARGTCPERPADGGATAFAAARDLDERADRGELDEHDVSERLRLHREAARAGHLEGQFRFGRLLFGVLFTNQAPEDDERAEYVEALTYLFLAALRGHEPARAIFPDMPAIVDGRRVPETLEAPLSDVPRPWIEEALAAALRLRDCFASP